MTNFVIPYTFVPGTKAKAQEVNANFSAIQDELIQKALLEGDETQSFKVATATENVHAVNKSQMETALNESSETISSQFDEKFDEIFNGFFVRSGNVDEDGNGDLLEFSGLIVTFKVGGSYPDLCVINTEGKILTFSELSSLDMTGFASGTYNVFVNDDGIVSALSNTIYRQNVEPTAVTDDIWLDTSIEPIKAYKFLSGVKNDFSGVLIGTVTIENLAISEVKTAKFNENGYNLNVNSWGNLTNLDRPATIVETYRNGTNWYRIYSDGWIEQGGKYGPSQGTVTFLKPFKNSNITLLSNCMTWAAGSFYDCEYANTPTATTFQHGANGRYFVWFACGY